MDLIKPFSDSQGSIHSSPKARANDQAEIVWLKVLGAPRSGTTLVQQILNTHPEVACFHEYTLQRLIATVDQLFEAETAMIQNTHVTCRLKELDDFLAVDDSALTDMEKKVAQGARRMARDFHGEREARVQEQMPLMLTPRRADFSNIVRGIVWGVAGKAQVSIVADKTPNYQFYHDNPVLFGRYDVRPRHLMILRNPIDVINSSLARRDNTLAGGDAWHIKTLNHAIQEWIANWEFAAAHADDESFLFLKYEDLGDDFPAQSKRIADFLGLKNEFKTFFEHLPPDLQRYAISDHEIGEIEAILGDLPTAWREKDLKVLMAEHPVIVRALSQPVQILLGGDEIVNVSLRNFDVAEEEWRWTLGHSASIRFKILGGHAKSKAWLELDFYPFFGDRGSFTLILRAPGGEQVHHVLNAAEMSGVATRGFVMPAPDGEIDLELVMPYVKQVTDEPVADFRPVGIQVRAVRAHLM
jgi:hypothetical protein